jgi:hypothetical protein
VAAAGDGGAYVGVCMLNDFCRLCAEEFFEEIGAAGDAELFSEDAKRVFAGDEVDVGDAGIGLESAEGFAREDRAGCAGDGEG